MGDDWDPLAIDTGDVAEPQAQEEVAGDGEAVSRIRREDMDSITERIMGELNKDKPWEQPPDAKPDLTWHTPTCDSTDWKHHDVRLEIGNGIAYVVFNRPNENNTMQETLSAGINDVLFALHARPDIRVVVFTGEGRMYCAGGDPKGWQAAAAAAKSGEYVTDGTAGVRIPLKPPTEEVQISLHYLGGRALKAGAFPDGQVNIGRLQAAKQWHTWASLPQFTICLANGSAMGGGVGCVCCCDYVISVKKAFFVLSEVKIGVIPATISPYVIQKIGTSNSKRLFCCAENLSATRAKDIGIVNEVVENMRAGHERVREICELISGCGPRAAEAAKQLVVGVSGAVLNESLMFYTCSLSSQVREGDEAKKTAEALKKGADAPWKASPIGFKEWPTIGVGKGKE